MRKISIGPIAVFSFLLTLTLILSILTTMGTIGKINLGAFTGVGLTIGFIVIFYAYSIFIYRVFLHFRPVPEGDVPKNSPEEFNHNVYVLYFLVLFRPLIGTKLIPVPINRIIYLLLGAELGDNTYCAGIILDPPLTEIGANSILGHDSTLYSHAIEGQHLSNEKIVIGDNVTIGAHSIVMSGVTIGNDAIIAAGSIVLKNTKIRENEIWAGIPARFIKTKVK
nr:acyltransferase [uncultured Desulfobacter sp.]